MTTYILGINTNTLARLWLTRRGAARDNRAYAQDEDY